MSSPDPHPSFRLSAYACPDSEKELLAAREGGVRWPVMCVRPGNSPLTTDSDGFAVVRSLLELCRCVGE